MTIPSVRGEEKKQTVEVEGNENRVLQLIEEKSKLPVFQHTAIKGRYNLVVQIIGDFLPSQLDEFLKNADDRQELARQLGLTEEALLVFAEDVLKQDINPAEWPARLQEIATRYHALKSQIDSYEGNDSIIAEIKKSANRALSKLDWKDADQLLEKAAVRDIEIAKDLEHKRRERQISSAESTAQRADAVLIGFEYLLAAERYLLAVDRLPEETDVLRAGYLNYAAVNFDKGGRYEEAEPLYRKGLEIFQRVLGKEHPDTATSYNNVAYILDAQGRYEKAEPLYRKGLEIRQRVLGEEHSDTANSYNNVASNLNAQGRYEEAEPLYRKNMEILQRVLGKEHPFTAISYNNVASNLNAQGRYEEAEPLYRKNMEIRPARAGQRASRHGNQLQQCGF